MLKNYILPFGGAFLYCPNNLGQFTVKSVAELFDYEVK